MRPQCKGRPPTAIAKMRSNIALATGDRSSGTCITTLLRWHFPTTRHFADPALKLPVQQVLTWIRLWKANTRDPNTKHKFVAAWSKLYEKMSKSDNRWLLAKGPLGATSATLLDLGIKPRRPANWITNDAIVEFNPAHSDHAALRVEFEIARIIEAKVWRQASTQSNAASFEAGPPDLAPAKAA